MATFPAPPAAAGYPDFQNYPSWRSANLAGGTNQVFAVGTTTLFTAAMQNYSSLRLRVTPSAGYGQVKVLWYLDSGLTQLLTTLTWSVSPTTRLSVLMPAQSGWCEVQVTVTSATAMTTTAFAAADNTQAPQISYPVTLQTINQVNVALAASASAIYPAGFIVRGTAAVSFSPADTAGKLDLQAVRLAAAGTVSQVLAELGAPTALANLSAPVLDDAWGLQVTNTDGAAPHTFSLYAVAGIGG